MVQARVRSECHSEWFFFSSRRRHTRFDCDWSSDVCSSDLWGKNPELTARSTMLAVNSGFFPQYNWNHRGESATFAAACATSSIGLLDIVLRTKDRKSVV